MSYIMHEMWKSYFKSKIYVKWNDIY